MVELNPFKKHFWGHLWGAWTQPIQGRYADGTQVFFQERKCLECGKVDREVLSIHNH